MKKTITTIKTISFLIILVFFTSCAAKKELVDLQEDYKSQEASLADQTQQNAALTEERNALIEKNTALESGNQQLENRITNLENSLANAKKSLQEEIDSAPECPELMVDGVVFKVQIGAYKEREIASNLTTAVIIDTEEEDGMQKTVIGQFRSYEDANILKKEMRAMGVTDAWIVSYQDGQRVPLKDVISND